LRLRPITLALPLVLLAASDVRAEYIVLRSGQRLHVTGYQLVDDKYQLQMAGAKLEIAAADVVGIEPEEVFTPIPPQPIAAAADPTFRELVAAAAKRYSVDADLITSVIAVESNFDPKAVSRKNARGLMQLLPETAERLGVKNVFDPQDNIDAGTRYLKELLQMYNNDLVLTLAAYNAGTDSVQKYGRVPPYAETITYVQRVKRSYEKAKSSAPAKAASRTAAAPANAATPSKSPSANVAAPMSAAPPASATTASSPRSPQAQ
jgi:soluble lytic murein transglycosylase-like protein